VCSAADITIRFDEIGIETMEGQALRPRGDPDYPIRTLPFAMTMDASATLGDEGTAYLSPETAAIGMLSLYLLGDRPVCHLFFVQPSTMARP
jgi:hypothetical protein